MTLRPPPAAGTVVLAVVTVVAAGLAVGPLRHWPGVVHLVALPPLDLAADLRWIVAWAPSWPVALVAGAASLAARTTVLATLLGGRRPRWGFALRLHLVAWPAVLLAAALWAGQDRLRTGVRSAANDGFTRMDTPHGSSATRDVEVLIASGINSSSGEGAIFGVAPEKLGVSCDQVHYFSYAGRGDGQPQGDAACPKTSGAPYGPEDTQRPFVEQVVLAHSQAAWVAWEVAASGAVPQLDTVVLVGPFPSSPLGYPPPGERGVGRVGGDLLRLLVPLTELVDFDFEVDAPLSRELLARPDAATEVWESGPPEDVRVLAVTTSADLLLMPDGWRIDGADDACPVRARHPDVPEHGDFHRIVDGYLDGRLDRACGPGPELLRAGTQAFGAPSPPR